MKLFKLTTAAVKLYAYILLLDLDIGNLVYISQQVEMDPGPAVYKGLRSNELTIPSP